jgi:Cu(I)/Ag(I) efflux system membrane fusion protein
VVVPEEAVVGTGIRDRIFVVRAPGKFEPRVVKVGVTADGFAQVLDGVKAGEEVVTSSEFLIDSESKLQEAAANMMEPHDEGGGSQEIQEPEHGVHP